VSLGGDVGRATIMGSRFVVFFTRGEGSPLAFI